MAGWLHGVFVGEWLFVFPLCGFSLSLFCNYLTAPASATAETHARVRCRPAQHANARVWSGCTSMNMNGKAVATA